MVPRQTAIFIIRKDACKGSNIKPIHIKCRIDGKKIVLGTGIMVHQLCWNDTTKQVVYNRGGNISRQQANDLNLALATVMNKAQTIFAKYRLRPDRLDVETFRTLFTSSDLAESFHEFFAREIELQQQIVAANTIKQYRTLQKVLVQFMPRLSMADLNLETVKRFDGFLQKRYNPNTRMKHHRMAKHYMLIATKKLGMPNPYEGFKVRHITAQRDYLNKYEVARLCQLHDDQLLPPDEMLSLKKYLFSCHVGGLRISDIHSVGPDDVFDGILLLMPQKTSRQAKHVQVPIPAEAMRFVQHTHGKVFFDAATDQYINRQLKHIAKAANISKKLSFHTSRHTYATGFLNAGGKVEVLQRILGHSDIKTTMVYVHISRERLKDEMDGMDLYG